MVIKNSLKESLEFPRLGQIDNKFGFIILYTYVLSCKFVLTAIDLSNMTLLQMVAVHVDDTAGTNYIPRQIQAIAFASVVTWAQRLRGVDMNWYHRGGVETVFLFFLFSGYFIRGNTFCVVPDYKLKLKNKKC